jgi:DNA-binding NarL/FixJ family response regulator
VAAAAAAATATAVAERPAGSKASVLLVDDHPIVREGLAMRLDEEADIAVCAVAADAHEALARVGELEPDLVITDLSLGGRPGLELVKDLAAQHPSLPVLVLSIHDETLWAERVLRAGARGYIMKSQATQKVVDAVRRVLSGGIWVSDAVNEMLLRRVAGKRKAAAGESSLETLTDRELEIYQMIGQGLTVREIAAKLYLSTKTVEVHRENIKEKLKLRSAMELIRHAVTHLLENS